tara:strand:+ start:10239 stop:11327 length:1089 start_codon:yes stop_codon:yes gene_type:complete
MEKNNYINIDTIDFDKLFDRTSIEIDSKDCIDYLESKKILITGGGGSIGSEIVKQLLYLDINQLYIIDTNEYRIHSLKCEIDFVFPNNDVIYLLHNITDKNKMKQIFEEIKPNIVFHAAAYKHVSLMEDNIYEATQINIFGTKIIADLSFDYNIEKFLFVSTDKAVNPTSVMGTSKRIAELYLHYLNDKGKTEYVITRFGNVFGSSGSVIPTFIDRLNQNRNLLVTHEEVIRYFMSIPESAKLVIKAVTIGVGGEILLFDMGNPVKIIDLAQNLLNMFPRKNVSIEIIGLQPGEKLYEELLCNSEEVLPTKEDKIMKFHNKKKNEKTKNFIDKYTYLVDNYGIITNDDLKKIYNRIVPEYNI